MFCNGCGKEIPNDSKVCKFCGRPVNSNNNTYNNMRSNRVEKNKKQIYQKWWFWLIIVVIVIAIFGGILGSSGENTTTSTNVESSSGEVTNVNNDSKNSSTADEDTKYNVGETFSNNNIKLTYVSVDNNFTGYSQYATVDSSYKIIRAEFEFENIGSTDYYLSYGSFNCYADGYSCDAFYSVDDAGLSGPFVGNISSGKKAKGNVYFEVPEDAKEVIIEYDASIWTSKKVEFVVE